MAKWERFVVDIKDTAIEEMNQLNCPGLAGWELVSVVSLPLCRRAYFKKKIPEPSQSEHEVVERRVVGEDGKMRIEGPEPQASESPAKDLKSDAIERIVNKKGGFEYVTMMKAIQKIIINDPTEAELIADEYYRDTRYPKRPREEDRIITDVEIGSDSQPEWTRMPNDGYYWTQSTIPDKMRLVQVFGGHYCPVEPAEYLGVNGHRFFWGPIPEPTEENPVQGETP